MLYFKTEATIGSYEDIDKLLVYVIALMIILLLKYLVIMFIYDKPGWVRDKEEELDFIKEEQLE